MYIVGPACGFLIKCERLRIMYHYSVPPPGYVRYSYNTSAATSPSSSPCPDPGYDYYVPHPKTPTASPTSRHTTKRHSRNQSYSSPRGPAGWHSPAGYPPVYYASFAGHDALPHDRPPYVSNIDRLREKSRRTSGYGGGGDGYGHHRHASMQSPTQRIIIDTSDEADDSPIYTYIKPRTGHAKKKYAEADPYVSYHQVHVDDDSSDSPPQRSRARRASHPTKPRPPPATKPAKAAKPAKPAPPPPVATAADAAKAGIPADYSIKNWDPTEAPVLLLGSVFDANSLGKWIYDWTVFHHGAATPMSDVAGDLWLLLIKLAGKMKRADECLPRIRARDNREMVEDFLESGDRLWSRFKKLLKACEEFMWKAAKKDGSKGSVKMGKNSGCEFVDSIFGRDRELEKTESLMQSIRLWNMRFDANCEDILRRPSAA